MSLENRVPAEVTPEILAFCRTLDPARTPVHVPVRPVAGSGSGTASAHDFAVVKDQVARHGGRIQFGWTLWENPGWFLEARFHAVWSTPEAALVDLSPGAGPESAGQVLFLPDTKRTFHGESVPNRFHPLSRSPDVLAVVQHAEFLARIQAEAETQARRARVGSVVPGRNDPCPCGSGLKYKKCCGRAPH